MSCFSTGRLETKKMFSLVNSRCLGIKFKLACDLKSASRKVIIQISYRYHCPSSGLLIPSFSEHAVF